MNIICLVKQVPDTSEIKIDKETNTLIRTGVKSIINPDDLAAVEEALKLKEQYGAKVTVITMGPKQAETMLKELYARGIDEAVLITDRKFAGSDTLATSTILSSMIKLMPYDLILAGYQAIDGDTAQVGPQVAELLNIPQVTYLQEITKIEEEYIFVKKRTKHEIQFIKAKLPCLLTTLSDMNKPRYMNAYDIFNSTDKEVKIVGFEDLNVDESKIGLKGSPTWVKKTFVKPVNPKSPVEKLEAEDAAKLIAKKIAPYIEVKNHEA